MSPRSRWLGVGAVVSAFVAACSAASPGGGGKDAPGADSGPGTGSSGGHVGGGTEGGPGAEGGATVHEARSSLPQDMNPDVPTGDQAALETGDLDFALAMYAKLRSSGGATANLFFSPYSISNALAMTYAGAAGQTATEIAQGMSFTLPQAQLHPAFDWLGLELASRSGSDTAIPPSPVVLHVANSLWGDDGLVFQEPFLDTLGVDYGAGVEQVDFGGDPEGARVAINDWVSENTNGDVPEVLPPGSLTADTDVVIVNAIYLHASWSSPFDPGYTSPRAFTTGAGAEEQVPSMEQITTFGYAESPDWQLVELPYGNGDLAMDVVLPADGTDAQFESGLTADTLTAMLQSTSPELVDLVLPKFKVAGPAFSLKTALEALGIDAAFNDGDFTPMVASGLSLTDVFHQAFIDVNENGTEAAAATAVVGGDGAAGEAGPPPTVYPMTVDRPFFIAIRDLPTNTLLFVGKIEDPAVQ